MTSTLKKIIFYKTKTKKEIPLFILFVIVVFTISSIASAIYLLPKEDRTNFLLGTGGVTMTSADNCYIGNPTPTLNWFYEKGFVPMIPGLFPPGEDQKTYQIQVYSDPGFTTVVDDSATIPSVGARSYMVPTTANLLFETTYYWRLRVTDTVDSSTAWIDGGSFDTPRNCAPTGLGFTPFGTTCNASDLWISSLTWTGYADYSFFNVYENLTGIAPWPTRLNVASNPSSETQSIVLTPDQSKFYKVTTTYAGPVTSADSAIFEVAPPSACNARIGSTPTKNCDSITITWTAAGDVDDFNVYRSVTNSPYTADVVRGLVQANTTNTFYQDNDIVSGTVTYEYFVEANAASGETLDQIATVTVSDACQDLPIWVEGR